MLRFTIKILLISSIFFFTGCESEKEKLEGRLEELQEKESVLKREVTLGDRAMRDLFLEIQRESQQRAVSEVSFLGNYVAGYFTGSTDFNGIMDYVNGGNEELYVDAVIKNKVNDLNEDREMIDKELKKVQLEIKKTQILIRQQD